MPFDKLFQFLARPDVKEIAVQTDRPPCVLVGEQYTPVANRNFSEDDVIAMLVEAGGPAEVMGLINGHRRWDYAHPSLGKIRVTAGYHGSLLQARFKLIEPAPQRPAAPAPQQPAAPSPERAPAPPAAPRAAQATGNQPRPAPAPRTAQATGNLAQPVPAPRTAQGTGNQPRPAPAPLPPKPAARAEPPPAAAPAPPPPPQFQVRGSASETFEALLETARERGASDLHIVAERPASLRIAGDLVPMGSPLPAALVEAMLLPQVPAAVRGQLDEHGACDFALVHPRLGRFRANVTRQRTGYKLTTRPIRDGVPTLSELGLPESISLATKHHQGLIVVTGPTGHGKTTTLAAIVDLINAETTHHIITVEDPIEYVHPRKRAVISQRQVGLHTKTFASALKASLREDPDVIVVGELRDTETVRMALSASETGHLVISTMNTPSAAKTIERLIDLFPPGDQPQVRMTLAGGLRLIISQRLLPTADRSGVCAAAELLPGSAPLWALIRDNKTFQIPSLQQRGKSLGIVRLDESLAELVRTGRTSLDIAKEYAEAPDQLEALVGQRAVGRADAFGPKTGKMAGLDRK